MSEAAAPQPPAPPAETPPDSSAERLALAQRAGGIVAPLLTVILAFLIAGFVVVATGHNPLSVYNGIIDGAGFNWFFHPSWTAWHGWVPFHPAWQTDTIGFASYNLTQTLLQTTPLILTGLAVAFAFRCGMFNIGGQGQYLVGLVVANWVGRSFPGMARPAHVLLAVAAATLAGAAWAGIAGLLKATTGAHEVITTIMLNWIAIWGASFLFGQGGPLQGTDKSAPISGDIAPSAHIWTWWGDPDLQGVHVGFFVAIGALFTFWIILNRTTLGYEVRAVGLNPEAAAYGGISVKKNYIVAMAISGMFAGLAGAFDMLGYLFHFGVLDIQASQVGFLGIAVALLGRNSAVGVGLAALLFGGLLYGTTHGIDETVFDPQLAGNLTLVIQGLVVLFVGADILILSVWNSRRKLRRSTPRVEAEAV